MGYRKIGGYKTHVFAGDRTKEDVLKRVRRMPRYKKLTPVKVTTTKRINGHPWEHRVYFKQRKMKR